MTDIKSLLKQAKRRTVTVPVCLRGDLATEYEQMQKQLAGLPKSNKLGGDPERQRITADMERIRAEMAEGTVDFVLRALSDTDFQELVDQHPPRRDGDDVNEGDAQAGYNRSTFYRAQIRACTIEPTLDDGDWATIFGEALSAGQMVHLSVEASRVNGQDVDVPFSPAGSSESQD